jgi:hypothetical protein
VKQVIDAMKIQPDFWYNYPIFLPDYQNPDYVIPYPTQQEVRPGQIDRPEDFEQFSPSLRSNLGHSRVVDAGTSVKSQRSQQPSFSNKDFAFKQKATVNDNFKCGGCKKEITIKVKPYERLHCYYCGFLI